MGSIGYMFIAQSSDDLSLTFKLLNVVQLGH